MCEWGVLCMNGTDMWLYKGLYIGYYGFNGLSHISLFGLHFCLINRLLLQYFPWNLPWISHVILFAPWSFTAVHQRFGLPAFQWRSFSCILLSHLRRCWDLFDKDTRFWIFAALIRYASLLGRRTGRNYACVGRTQYGTEYGWISQYRNRNHSRSTAYFIS